MKIRAYVRMDEVNKVHFYKDFEVVDFVPEVGDPCFGEEIKEITPVQLDVEQGKDEVYTYDYFKIITTMNKEFDKANNVYCERWYAVKKPMLRVELHYWKEGSGYSHSETFDEVLVGFTAEQYVNEYDGNLLDDDEYDAINVELYDNDNNLISEYWLSK